MSGLPLHKRKSWRCSNHTKYQPQPGRADSAQSSVVTQQDQNLKLKGCYCFLKRKKWGCWAWQSSWETFCLRGWTLLLNFVSNCAYHHTIGLAHTGTCRRERCVRLHRDELSSGGWSVGREKGSCTYLLGKITLAIDLHKSIGHLIKRQATCEEPMPEKKDISLGLFYWWLEAEWDFITNTCLVNWRYSTFTSNWWEQYSTYSYDMDILPVWTS